MLNKKQIADVAERAVSTYVQVFLGLWASAGIGLGTEDLGTAKMAAIGAIPAALSVVKGLLAAGLPLGDSTASVLRLVDAVSSKAEAKAEEIQVTLAPTTTAPIVKKATVKRTAPAKKAAPAKAAPKKAPAKKA
jgi:hypothetical protein